MQGRRAAVENLFDEGGDGGAGSPVLGESSDLFLRGDLAGDEKPEETFRKRLRPARSLGKSLLDLGDGLSTEADTLLCKQWVSTRDIAGIEAKYTHRRRGRNHPR